MRISLTFSFLLISILVSNAQPYFDVLNVYGQWSGPNKLLNEDSAEVSTRFFSAELSIPVKIKNDVLALSPSYSELHISEKSFSSINLQSLQFPLAFVKQWSKEKIKTSFVLIARTNSDSKEGIGDNTFQLGAVILHTIKKLEGLKFKFGAYYNSEFFGPFILPLAGIDWKVSERLNIFGVLPGSMNLEYFLSSRIHTGISFRSITNSYRQANNTFIRINDNHLKVVADFYISKKQVITLEAGHSILRKYKSGWRLGGETSYYDLEVNNGYLLKIGYAFRFRLDEK